jgi:hypothetical protein
VAEKTATFLVSGENCAHACNLWWFSRVFHTGALFKNGKCRFCHGGGFTGKRAAPITRSSLKSAAPNGGGHGSKSLKTNGKFDNQAAKKIGSPEILKSGVDKELWFT